MTGIVAIEHVNAVEIDYDGNILLSSRNLNEITKINRSDGSIMWRLGGKRNEFNFINCPVPFYGQHDIRRQENGHITLFDNGYCAQPHGARAMEFELDEKNKTASLVWNYIYDSSMVSTGQGNVQRLANGNTLVNYGRVTDDIVFVVVDSNKHRLFELFSSNHLDSYRSFYYPSLPWQFHRPRVVCFDSLGVKYLRTEKAYSSYEWSDSSTTTAIAAKKGVAYSVFVPYGEGGFISSEKFSVADTSACTGRGKKSKGLKGSKLVYFYNPENYYFETDCLPFNFLMYCSGYHIRAKPCH